MFVHRSEERHHSQRGQKAEQKGRVFGREVSVSSEVFQHKETLLFTLTDDIPQYTIYLISETLILYHFSSCPLLPSVLLATQ